MAAKRKIPKSKNIPSPWPLLIEFSSPPSLKGDLGVRIYDLLKSKHELYVARISEGSLSVLRDLALKHGHFPGVFYLMLTYAQLRRYQQTKKNAKCVLQSTWEN